MLARAVEPSWPARLRPGGDLGEPEEGRAKMSNGPHAKELFSPVALAHAGPRCAARRKFDGGSCQQPAMANGRCRMHGGKSTGPRTAEGLERSRKARWKHGHYSRKAREERAAARAGLRLIRAILNAI